MDRHCDSNSRSHTDGNHLSPTMGDPADMVSDGDLSTVVLYTQACASTGFAADQVLTWTPLLLVIDAGSMLQLFVLVLEAGSLITRSKTELITVQLNLKRRYTKFKWRIHSIHLHRRRQPQCFASKSNSVSTVISPVAHCSHSFGRISQISRRRGEWPSNNNHHHHSHIGPQFLRRSWTTLAYLTRNLL